MKTRKILLSVAAIICMSFSSKAINPSKTVMPIEAKNTQINFQHFTNYLMNGNPQEIEGYYGTKDKKYIIAIIKNDVKQHDYIGVMVGAKNSKYNPGELRFNFVVENDSMLNGFYYDDRGNAQAVKIKIKTSNAQSACLFRKIHYSEIPNFLFAKEFILSQSPRNRYC